MTLPTPSLDDRRFQDIVDEAKRLIPRHCPEWTDHNVSDPGIALVELFAWMTDLTLYRLNQVPDRLYTKFLELMGIQLYSAASARTELVFWLSAPLRGAGTQPVTVPEGTQAGTLRTERDDAIVFLTDAERIVVAPTLSACLTVTADGRYEDAWDDLRLDGYRVRVFPGPAPGAAVHLGFTECLAGNVVRLDIVAPVQGIGVVPDRPPWSWEVWSGEGWTPCRILRDTTMGLNTGGELVLVVPPRHEPLTLGPHRAHWLRCRMLAPQGDQEGYRESPELESLAAASLGGMVSAHHAEPTGAEWLGTSDGIPGQRFAVRRAPVLPRREGESVVVGGTAWEEVRDFSQSGEDDRHVMWDGASGELTFGPRVVHPDGSVHQHGAVPALDAPVSVLGYRHGGGRRGNVGARTVTVLKTSLPFVARVENLDPARGGVDAETVDNAKLRGPMSLRSGQRAVTAADFERLTLEAAPAVARAHCLPPALAGGPVRVLIVPRLDIAPEALVLDDLRLPPDLVARVSDHLDERRMLTTAVELRTPSYQGVTVVARLTGAPGSRPELVRDRALSALYAYVNPLVGGPEGHGWPFGRHLNLGEVFALLSGVEGVVGVEEVRLFLADLRRGERREGRQRVQLPSDALFASFQHQVRVQ